MKLIDDEDEKVLLPDNVHELDEMAEKMWLDYFSRSPAQERKLLMVQYNEVAKKANELANMQRHIILTPSTQWIPDINEEGIVEPPKKRAPVVSINKEKQRQEPVAPAATTPAAAATKLPGAGGTIIQQIIALHEKGLSNKEIIEKGFNKSTVARQVSEFKKRKM